MAAGRPFPSPGVAERDNRVLSDSLCYYLALTICILIKKSYSEFVVDEKSAGALLLACTQVRGQRGEAVTCVLSAERDLHSSDHKDPRPGPGCLPFMRSERHQTRLQILLLCLIGVKEWMK